MINEHLIGPHATDYTEKLIQLTEEYERLPWADSFVKQFAKMILDFRILDLEGGDHNKSIKHIAGQLPGVPAPQLASDIRNKILGKGDNKVSMAGFLMGRALAEAAFEHGQYSVLAVIDLQHRWWAHSGFESVVTSDLASSGENSRAYQLALKLVEWLNENPGYAVFGTEEKKQFSRLCNEWRNEGKLDDIWSFSSGWNYYASSRFGEDTLSYLLAKTPQLIMPLLDGIRIPKTMSNVFRATEIMFDSALLQLIMEVAPSCTDLDENSISEGCEHQKSPNWNGSIMAAALLPFILEHAQALARNSDREAIEASRFLEECATIMIARPDGLFLAERFVARLHKDMDRQSRESQSSVLFMDSIVSAVERKGKNSVLAGWIASDYNEKLNNFSEADWKQFIQTGRQSELQEGSALEDIVARARLLPLTDLTGVPGEMLLWGYTHSFCYYDESFYTSEHSDRLPSMMHDALGLIFLAPVEENPAAKWEAAFRYLGAAENRIFRDFYDKKKLHLHYLVNFHMAVGLALADGTYAIQDENRAKQILRRLFERALGLLQLDDRLQDAFYKRIIRILVCKSYLYSIKGLNDNTSALDVNDHDGASMENNSSLSEVVGYLRASQSVPMLCFEILEDLQTNGLKMEDICDCKDLLELARNAYTATKIIDQNNYWKFRDDKNLEILCKRRLDHLWERR